MEWNTKNVWERHLLSSSVFHLINLSIGYELHYYIHILFEYHMAKSADLVETYSRLNSVSTQISVVSTIGSLRVIIIILYSRVERLYDLETLRPQCKRFVATGSSAFTDL